jgi:protein-S-isoprenylcysteine O-methyltransferase Ste14
MSFIPEFHLGLWNAWLFITPYLLVSYGLSFLICDKKAALFIAPDYTDTEKKIVFLYTTIMFLLIMYSIFLPLKEPGTVWFYAGIIVYIPGFILVLWSTISFAVHPVTEPLTGNIYRFSRNPMYLGFLLIYLGTGLAAASWIYLLFGLVSGALAHFSLIPPEEKMCLKKYGEKYQTYMEKTQKWFGLPG